MSRRMLDRILRRLNGPNGPLLLAAFAVLLSLPALRLGFQADDHFYRASHARGAPAWELFSVSAAESVEQRDRGYWSWWASPRLEIAFLRPVSALIHWVEFNLFAESPHLMLLVNVLLYGALVFVAALLYRRLAPELWIAGLAGSMFAIDDAHAWSVGWISGRNTLLSAFFSLAALLLHVEARALRSRWRQAGGVVCVALALLSAEAGSWSLAFLVAYALVFEVGPLHARLRSIAPQLGAGLVWAAGYWVGGFGLRGTTWYRELSAPLFVIQQGVLDLPLWTTSLVGPSMVSASMVLPVETTRLLTLPFALLALGFLAAVLPSSKECRFFALATLLCLLPLFTTVQQDRVTLGASFGVFGWLACFVYEARASARLAMRAARQFLLAMHLWLPLLLFPMLLTTTLPMEKAIRAIVAKLAPVQQVVLINSPIDILNSYVMNLLSLPVHASRKPSSFHSLYAGASDLVVERVDERTLDVAAARGWGYLAAERMFCAAAELPRVGEERRARGLTAKVMEGTATGLPARVRFEFSTVLEDRDRQWLVWREGGPVAWAPPAIGQRARIVGSNLFRALPR